MIRLTKLPCCDKCGYWESETASVVDGRLRAIGVNIKCKNYNKCEELVEMIREELNDRKEIKWQRKIF